MTPHQTGAQGRPERKEKKMEREQIIETWESLNTQIFNILDEEGVNMANAQARQIDNKSFIYVDDEDGYTVMDGTIQEVFKNYGIEEAE